MNTEVARLKSAAVNPESTPERKAAALAALTEIATGSLGPKTDDAIFALREIEACPQAVQTQPAGETERAESDSLNDVNDPDHFLNLFLDYKARDEAYYAEARTRGWTADETVARLRAQKGIHAAMRYGVILAQVENCRRDGPHAARAYFCPIIRARLKEAEEWSPYDWPAIQLAKAALAEFDSPLEQATATSSLL
jgi:hypothetical protein